MMISIKAPRKNIKMTFENFCSSKTILHKRNVQSVVDARRAVDEKPISAVVTEKKWTCKEKFLWLSNIGQIRTYNDKSSWWRPVSFNLSINWKPYELFPSIFVVLAIMLERAFSSPGCLASTKTHKSIKSQLFENFNNIPKDLQKSSIEHRESKTERVFILQYANLRIMELFCGAVLSDNFLRRQQI